MINLTIQQQFWFDQFTGAGFEPTTSGLMYVVIYQELSNPALYVGGLPFSQYLCWNNDMVKDNGHNR